MEKNVVVLDEQGKKIGMTYPKRARGLVKKGRARCVDACTICLACPPDMDLEDIRMNDNNINIPEKSLTEAIITEQESAGKSLTQEYFLDKIDRIAKDTAYLKEAMEFIRQNSKPESPTAVGQMVAAREKTNQMLIDFYKTAYFRLMDKPDPQAKQEEIVASMRRSETINRLLDGIIESEDEEKTAALVSILRDLIEES